MRIPPQNGGLGICFMCLPRKVIFGHFIDFEYFGSDFSCFYIVKTPEIEMASQLSFMGSPVRAGATEGGNSGAPELRSSFLWKYTNTRRMGGDRSTGGWYRTKISTKVYLETRKH